MDIVIIMLAVLDDSFVLNLQWNKLNYKENKITDFKFSFPKTIKLNS